MRAAPAAGRGMAIPRTLCFITNGDATNRDVLLMKRADTRRIFPGLYNGVGGHIERDEDPYTSVVREVREETGLTVTNVQLRGIYHVDVGQSVGVMVFVFSAESGSRDVIQSDEGTLHWVPIVDAHTLPLVEDVPILLSRLFGADSNDALFFAHARYDDKDRLVLTFAPTQS